MADVNINKFRASVVRDGSKPASPGFIVSEGQDPVDPAGNGQNHLPVTIATAATGLSITDSQVLGGAGNVGQYIRGDGSLADFPQASGGGSSVSYYLNGSISQGTIGGVAYKELNKVPILGAGTDFTINADGYIASFLTDAGDPNLLEIPGGNWNFETYFSASSGGGSPSFYVELYKYDGTTFTLIASSSTSPELIAFGTNLNPYFSTLAVPTTTLALTDRLAVRYYVTHSGRTITLHTENNHLCQVVTTFTTGLTSLNGLTAQVQNLAVGTSGTDFNIASATATHTFNLPTASATNRGALSSADWTTFNNKQNALGYVPVPETRTITINGVSQDLSANRTYNVGTVTSVGLSSATSGVTIGSSPVTTSGTITLAIATASGSQNGLLSSTDWTTFNNKQNALTNPVTGTGTTNYLPKFTGASTIGNSNIQDSGSLVSVGVAANFSSSVTSLSLDVISASGVGSSAATGLARFITAGTSNGIAVGQSNSSRYTAILANEHIIYNDDFFMRTNGNFPLSIGTNNTTNLRVFSDGNVLIQTGGTFTNNGARLQVSGTATISSFITAQSSGGSGLRIYGGSGTNQWDMYLNGANLRFSDNTGTGSFVVDRPATFSSSVTAASAIFSGSIADRIIMTRTSIGSYHLAISTTNRFSIYDPAADLERLSITSSGNVGIGTTSPEALLHVNAASTGGEGGYIYIDNPATSTLNNSVGIRFVTSSGGSFAGVYTGNIANIVTNASDGASALTFGTWNGSTASERMRITSGGYMKARANGGTYFGGSYNEIINNNNVSGAICLVIGNSGGTNTNNTSSYHLIVADNGGDRLYIYGNGNVVNVNNAYGTLSDIALKENIKDATPKLEDILKLKVRNFNLIGSEEKQIGFIAQELEEIFPKLIDVNGIDKMKSIKTTVLIPILVKAIQELKQEIDTLKN